MDRDDFLNAFADATSFTANPFHPMVWILGAPEIAEDVFIGAFSVVNATGSSIRIGRYCDIAPFVAINAADSHRRCLELADEIDRRPIILEEHVFVGSHSVIKGGASIGHHSVVAAGTIVEGVTIPPFSLVTGNPMSVRPGYYRDRWERRHASAH